MLNGRRENTDSAARPMGQAIELVCDQLHMSYVEGQAERSNIGKNQQ